MKKQILVIHGGEVFKTYEDYFEHLKKYEINLEKIKKGGWKDHLQESLGDEYDVLFPQMPNYRFSKYAEWKLWIEKFIPYLKDDLILIGNSLGSIFLAKYLAENDMPVKVKALILIAGPYDEKDRDCTLEDFALSGSLEKVEEQADRIFIVHSKDDPVVPFVDSEKFAKALPKAEKIDFEDKGHFNLKEFPEMIELIKSL